MKITHSTAAPTGAAPAEPCADLYAQEIAAGRLMGVTIRCASIGATEVPVSLELGGQLSLLVLDYIQEQLRLSEEKIANLESRQALRTQKGGQAL